MPLRCAVSILWWSDHKKTVQFNRILFNGTCSICIRGMGEQLECERPLPTNLIAMCSLHIAMGWRELCQPSFESP